MENFEITASKVKGHIEIRVPGKGAYQYPADAATIKMVSKRRSAVASADFEQVVATGKRVHTSQNHFHKSQNKKIRAWAMSERNAYAVGGFKNADLKDYYNLAA